MSLLEIRKKGTRLFSSFCYFYWRWSIKICRRGFILLTPNQESLEKKDKTFFQFILTTYRQWTINSSPQRLKNVIGLHLLDSPMTKMSHQNQSSEYYYDVKKVSSWILWIFMIWMVDQSRGESLQRWAHSSHTRQDCTYKTASDWQRRLPLISQLVHMQHNRYHVNQAAKATPYFVTSNGYPPRRILKKKKARVVEVLSIKAHQKSFSFVIAE